MLATRLNDRRFDGPRFDHPRFDAPRFDAPRFEAWARAERRGASTPPKGVQGARSRAVTQPPARQHPMASTGPRAGPRSPGTAGARRPLGAVVFLDVDGVLHSVRCTRLNQQFGRAQMQQLVRAIQATGADIVLSTAWRTIPEARRVVCEKLREYGLPQPVGRTPDFGMPRRPCEILTWVEQHRPAAWVAIDDMPLDADPRMQGHFVRTNPIHGLTPLLCQEAIRVLQQQME